MRRRWRRQALQEPPEMNITAFMNLMVILVPFLLITAVFSRMTILGLELPVAREPDTQAAKDRPGQRLELVLRRDRIVIAEQDGAAIEVGQRDGHYDLARVSALLTRVKAAFPDKTDITLLLEPEIAYDDLVQVMDAVRQTVVERQGRPVRVELFPDIAIGDAPAAGRG